MAGPFKGDLPWDCFHCKSTLDLTCSYSLAGCAGCTGVNARPTLACDGPGCHAAALDRVKPFKVVGGKGRKKKKRNRSSSESDTPTKPTVPVKRAAPSKRRNLTDSSSGSEMEQEEVKDTCPKPTPAPRTSKGHPPKESAPT